MATDAEKLTAAEDALHKLVTGQLARVFVDQNGERVEFTSTNADALRRYIASLKLVIDPTTARAGFNRPIGFLF